MITFSFRYPKLLISNFNALLFYFIYSDPKQNPGPLHEAKLELHVPEMVFLPSLDFGVADGFYDEIDGLVGDVYKQSSLIPRLAAHSGQQHYQVRGFEKKNRKKSSNIKLKVPNRI